MERKGIMEPPYLKSSRVLRESGLLFIAIVFKKRKKISEKTRLQK